jgi:hypothetical protein
MTHTRRVIETNQSPAPADAATLVGCIEACFDCAQTCTACAEACRRRESACNNVLSAIAAEVLYRSRHIP